MRRRKARRGHDLIGGVRVGHPARAQMDAVECRHPPIGDRDEEDRGRLGHAGQVGERDLLDPPLDSRNAGDGLDLG